jgi:hypothetical protein
LNLTLARDRHALLTDCLAAQAMLLARSERFALYDLDPRQRRGDGLDGIVLVHDFARSEIDNNVAARVAYELLPLLATWAKASAPDGYALSEQQIFERCVGAIVRSVDDNEQRAWHLFYDNTLNALERAEKQAASAGREQAGPDDFILTFAAIYARAIDLIVEAAPETWLDAATCFGFLPLHLARGRAGAACAARLPQQVFACDLNAALVSLARDYARHRRLSDLRFFRADLLAPAVPGERTAAPPRCDVVTAIHVLEHLEPEQTPGAIDALWSRTARRLIIAVPAEANPDPRFGHRQVFDLSRLRAFAQAIDGSSRCFEDHGVWLVIDRHPPPQQLQERDR